MRYGSCICIFHGRLAIIERGELLAEGSVDQILQGRAFEHQRLPDVGITLRLSLLGDLAAARDWLLKEQQLDSKPVDEQTLELEVPDDPLRHAELLRNLVLAGIQVTRYTTRSRSLEEAFLQVTRGNVQ